MIDLSNNNHGAVDFEKVYAAGHRRVYLKASESTGFTDALYHGRRSAAHGAGLLVGGYHFAHGNDVPRAEADHFLAVLGALNPALDLVPALDLELGTASAALGKWAVEFLEYVRSKIGRRPVLYSYSSFLSACQFAQAPAALWLAAYGRNDGKEYPFVTPYPWNQAEVAAHQFASQARVPGVTGFADISHVFRPQAFTLEPQAAV